MVSPVRVWFDKLPVMFAQDISMEHLSCPLTPPKTSQMPTKLVSGLFMLLFLLLLPNWLSDRLPELAIGKLARSAHAKTVEANMQPFARREDWTELAKKGK